MPFIMPSKKPPPPVGPPTGWQSITSSPDLFEQHGYIGANMYVPFYGKNLYQRGTRTLGKVRLFDHTDLTYGPADLPDRGPWSPGYGSGCVLSGGVVLFKGHLTDGASFDPTGGSPLSWVNTINTPNVSKTRMVAARTGDIAYTYGGWAGGINIPPVNNSKYTQSNRTWADASQPPPARLNFHDATLLNDGRVLVGGGRLYNGAHVTNYDYWFHDPILDTYTPTTPVPSSWHRFERAGCVQLQTGEVFFAGGAATFGGSGDNSVVIFDVKTENWSLGSLTLPGQVLWPTEYLQILPDGQLAVHRLAADSWVATYV